MKQEWHQITIGDLGKVVTGNTPPKNDPENYGGKYPFIKPTDMVKDQRYVFDYEETYSEKAFRKFKNAYIPPFSTGVVTIGTVGEKLFLSHEWCFTNQSVNVIIPDEEKYDKMFVYYLMKYNLPQVAKANPGTASGRHHVSKSNFCSIQIEVPPLLEQQKIAFLLSTYDDLIENNNRRIAIHEEMARNLYREWFVKFRFPGHEEVKMIDSELGQIPEGWRIVNIPEAVEINPTVKIQKNSLNPFVPMDAISESSMVIKYSELKNGNSGSKFMNADTLFARITPSLENGKTAYVQFLSNEQSVGFGSTEFIVFRSKLLTPEYVYCLARSNEFRDNAIKSMTGASGRQRVQNECFNNFFIALSTHELLDKFSSIVKPLFETIHNLNKKNQNLKTQQDMLLPKLISGRITID